MARSRAPAGGITIGGVFYRGGAFIPPLPRARAPAGGVTIGGVFYRGGTFLPRTFPSVPPPAGPVLEPDTSIVDALVQIGPPELGDVRTVRVYVLPGQDERDVLNEIEQVVEAWNEKYTAGLATVLVDFWRQR